METKKRVLLVDDEPEFTATWENRLRGNGYDVQVAMDGTQALERLKAGVPDIIIADVLMPEMDGFALCKELKKDRRTSDIPVLIVTGRSKMADAFAVLGIEDYLIKPFDDTLLFNKVENLLIRQRSAAQTEFTGELLSKKRRWAVNGWILFLGGFLLVVFAAITFLIVSMTSTSRDADAGKPPADEAALSLDETALSSDETAP